MTDTTQKETTDKLLPWYINNTLSSEEKVEVIAYLEAGGKEAEAELQLLQKIAEQSQQNCNMPSPGELGWKRLQRQIRAEGRENVAVQSKGSGLTWYRPALAAALAIIVVQGAFLLDNKSGSDGDLYQPLSASQAQTPLLQVQFSPATTAQQVREVLRAAKVNIVDGPSAVGIYRLQATPATLVATQAAAKKLNAHSNIITHLAIE
ncbi:hypothetical protein MNBD_GAMMA26-1184 [hydrothermal vent metagenome]|uniref:Uncharacterized protein n=1 Tax=hydrothermal vent metagenome TaxID=652676 RepID=A0A3B1BCU3_9ZZZZ